MLENNSELSENQFREDLPIAESPISAKKKFRWPARIKKLEKIGISMRNWTITFFVFAIGFAFARSIYVELNDDAFHIIPFTVPEEFAKDGYDGTVVANQLLERTNSLMLFGNRTRSLKDMEQYNQSTTNGQLQIEVAGLGFSPEVLSNFLRSVLGIENRTIKGEIVKNNNSLRLFLYMTGQKVEVTYQVIQDGDKYAAMDNLIRQAAYLVLKVNNPLLLGLVYLEGGQNDLAIENFRYAVYQRPEQAANAYAYWGLALYNLYKDSTFAMPKIRKSLALKKNNITAYQILGGIQELGKKQREELLKRSLEEDPSWVETWILLATLYHDEKREVDELRCYEKCLEIDDSFEPAYKESSRILYFNGRVKEAEERLEKLEYLNSGWGGALSIAVFLAQNDILQANRIFQKEKKRDPEYLSHDLNFYAYELEIRGEIDKAIPLAKFAVSIDSTAAMSALPYSTLAELYGLKNNQQSFYYYLEKAFTLGLKSYDLDLSVPPYSVFKDREDFKRLVEKYR